MRWFWTSLTPLIQLERLDLNHIAILNELHSQFKIPWGADDWRECRTLAVTNQCDKFCMAGGEWNSLDTGYHGLCNGFVTQHSKWRERDTLDTQVGTSGMISRVVTGRHQDLQITKKDI